MDKMSVDKLKMCLNVLTLWFCQLAHRFCDWWANGPSVTQPRIITANYHVVCKMAMQLKFYEGAKPGKKRKAPESEREVRKKEYEKNRPERKFSPQWQVDYPWLLYDATKQMMTCTDCVSLYGEKVNSDNNLQRLNSFILGCTNFRLGRTYCFSYQ